MGSWNEPAIKQQLHMRSVGPNAMQLIVMDAKWQHMRLAGCNPQPNNVSAILRSGRHLGPAQQDWILGLTGKQITGPFEDPHTHINKVDRPAVIC